MLLPSIDSLRCFVAAARLLNFRKAARSVALTPAAFGQRIKQLEEQLGVALFSRNTRSVLLTGPGIAFRPYAERCIAVAEDAVRAARGDAGPAPLDLIVGTRHELGLSWILPQFGRLEQAHPWLQLHLYFGSGSDLLLRVRTLEIDCAVTSTLLSEPKLDGIRLHREHYRFVAATKLLQKSRFTEDADAARHTLLDIDPGLPLFRYWKDAAGGGRLTFGRYRWLGTIAAIRARVLEQAGVAVLPEYLVRRDIASGRLQPLLSKVVPLHDHFRLVYRADDPRRTIFESLAASLMEVPLQ